MLPIPTVRLAFILAVAAVLTAVSPFGQPLSTLVVVGIIALLALVDLLRMPDPSVIEVERDIGASLPLGSETTVTWRVRNPTEQRQIVAIADEFAPSLGAANRRALATIPGRGTATITTTLQPSRRGRFRISELVVRLRSPWGLVERQRTRQMPQILRVLPLFRSRQEAELLVTKARQLDMGIRSARGKGGGTEFDQLREYTPDDEFRRIDWAATARTGTTIARTYRAELNQTVINLLDNGRVMAGVVAGVPRVEHAMDAVMALTTVSTGLGDKCGLLTFDREVGAIVQPSRNRTQLGRVTDAMYSLEPALVESDYRGAFTAALRHFRRRTMIVVHTELLEAVAQEFLLPALPLISRSHIVVIATVRDPLVEQWASAPVTDAETAYRQSSATKALAERERTIAALKSKGALVVDAAPGELAGKLAETYLRVKAAGTL